MTEPQRWTIRGWRSIHPALPAEIHEVVDAVWADTRIKELEAGGDRLYNALAMFDSREDTPLAELVRSAREGYERSHPDMAEADAWAEFDARMDHGGAAEQAATEYNARRRARKQSDDARGCASTPNGTEGEQ